MKVAFVTPEVAPYSKTGGLGDVSGALPDALNDLGAEVTVFSPLYRSVRRHRLKPLPNRYRVPVGDRVVDGGARRAGNIVFVECDAFFDRDALYGTAESDYPDNASRFIFFSRAVLELLKQMGPPDIVHGHDWQAGLLPVYLRSLYAGDFPDTRSIFTIHNLAYQGLFWHWDMPLTGLDWSHFNWREMEFYGMVSFLKSALVHADALTTVSPTYAREIQGKELGCGLEGVLKQRAGDLRGILNGADTDAWNPQKDKHLPAQFSAGAPAGKKKCKAALQKRCGLPVAPKVPLIGFIGRMAEQKGMDILVPALDALGADPVQFVILGTGDRKFQDVLMEAGRRHPERISVQVAFDNGLAHQIEAGADIFVMPSRYEPCGLNQIYSLRYGAVPIVRSTGGLADTVADGRTGFVFRSYTTDALVATVRRATAAYVDSKAWRAIMKAGMAADFSWKASAREYLRLYREVVTNGAGRR